MHIYSFEKLQVWKDARLLVKWIYKTSSVFPADEKFGLVMQLRRAAVSVVSNLAEGSSRTSFKDQAHFSQIAYSSLTEILNQLIIGNDLGFLPDEMLTEGRNQIELLTAKIASLRKTQLAKSTKPKLYR